MSQHIPKLEHYTNKVTIILIIIQYSIILIEKFKPRAPLIYLTNQQLNNQMLLKPSML